MGNFFIVNCFRASLEHLHFEQLKLVRISGKVNLFKREERKKSAKKNVNLIEKILKFSLNYFKRQSSSF